MDWNGILRRIHLRRRVDVADQPNAGIKRYILPVGYVGDSQPIGLVQSQTDLRWDLQGDYAGTGCNLDRRADGRFKPNDLNPTAPNERLEIGRLRGGRGRAMPAMMRSLANARTLLRLGRFLRLGGRVPAQAEHGTEDHDPVRSREPRSRSRRGAHGHAPTSRSSPKERCGPLEARGGSAHR